MHDLKMVREHVDALREGMRRRGALSTLGPAIDRAVALDRARRETIQAVEERKAARNAATHRLGGANGRERTRETSSSSRVI